MKNEDSTMQMVRRNSRSVYRSQMLAVERLGCPAVVGMVAAVAVLIAVRFLP